MTIDQAIKAVSECYRNTNYSLEEALDNMEAIVDLARENVAALLEDLGNQ